MENLSGQVVKSYQLFARIGTGGYGAVYRAIQPNIDREVAIKVILPEYANRPVFIRRFEAEAQVVARLEHPHIVPLYDYWREPNSAYLVMRFLRGGSLRAAIDEHGPWSLKRVGQMLYQICSALAFAHQSNVIHRDLKSDNILLDDSGNCYLGDFGIAKDLDVQQSLTKDSILGTPAYLAPEQIRGEIASAQTDIYALGILTYEVLTGTKPFTDVTPATIMYRQLNEPLPDVTVARPDLPTDVNLILQRATAKDKTLRYDSALDFAREFQDSVRSAAISTPTPGSSPPGLGAITQAEQSLLKPPNPYKGLRAFQRADAGDFFGRDQLIQRLLQRLQVNDGNEAFLAVVGPSGSGKSSVVKAGLMPRIQDGVLGDDIDWYLADMVPGTHPIEELEASLLGIATMDMPGLFDQLAQNERGLVRAVKRLLPGDSSHLVLIIDQFEEVFTLVEDEQLRKHFLDLILAAIQDARSRIRVIITLRADFYDRPLYYNQFGDLIRRRTEIVLPLSDEELEAAMRGPAERVGVAVEPALVSTVVSEVSQQPGALPLLQYALTELYERSANNRLTLDVYNDIGGVSGALAKRAEDIFQDFDEQAQQIARQIFMRLVALGEGTEDTRRRATQEELLSLSEDRDRFNRVIETYGRSRLLTFDHDPQTRHSTIEVAHEALIRQWERLREWLDDNREGLRLQRRLTASSLDWIQAGKDRSFLARGVRLQQIEDWVASSDMALNDLETEYLQASVAEREEQKQVQRSQIEREERLVARARNRLRALAVVLALATVLALGLAGFGLNQGQIATDAQIAAEIARDLAEDNEEAAARNAAEARSLAVAANARSALAENDPRLALSLALAAEEVYDETPSQVRQVLFNVAYAPGPSHKLQRHDAAVISAAYAADGSQAASVSVDGMLLVWDALTGDMVQQIAADTAILDIAFHPDNARIVAGLSDGSVRIWSAETGEQLTAYEEAHDGMVTTIAVSNDGTHALSGGDDQQIILWEIDNGREVRRFEGHKGAILNLDFASDGDSFVSTAADAQFADTNIDAEDRTVRVWDVESGEQRFVIDPDSGLPRAVDYSPDGRLIAVGVWDETNGGTVRIYDAETGEELERFFGHANVITAVVFSPDSELIVSAAWDQTIRIRDVERGTDVRRFDAFDERPLAVDYAPDGSHLLIGTGNVGDIPFSLNDSSRDTTVWLWDLRYRDEVLSFEGHSDWVWSVDLHPDEQMAATGSGPLRLPAARQGEAVPAVDTSVRLWDVQTGEQTRQFNGHSNTVDAVVFHPDGETLFSGAWDGFIIRWNIETGERVALYREHSGRVFDVNLSADGNLMLSAGDDPNPEDDQDEHIAYLWDTETGEILQTFRGHTGGVNSAVFSPDETTVATGSSDRTIRLWDVETGEELQRLEGHTASVNEVIFSPDGTLLASSSWDDSVRLWDVASGQQLRGFAGHNGNTFGLAFSSDARALLSTSEDSTIRLWDLETGNEIHRFGTHSDWIQEIVLSKDGSFAVSAAQDRTAKVWRVDQGVSELLAFVADHRYVRPLTCAERERYGATLC